MPVEFDLLILAPTAAPADGVVYEPSQVIAVLEVKNAGSFGDAKLTSIRRASGLVRPHGSDARGHTHGSIWPVNSRGISYG